MPTPPEFGVQREVRRQPSGNLQASRSQQPQARFNEHGQRETSHPGRQRDAGPTNNLEQLRTELLETQEHQKEVSNKYQLLKSAYKSTRNSLKESALNVSQLEEALESARGQARLAATAQAELAKLQAAETANHRERANLRMQLERTEATRGSLVSELQERDGFIQHLQGDMQGVVQNRDQLHDRLTALRAALEARLEAVSVEKQSLQDQHHALQQQMASLRAEHHKATEDLSKQLDNQRTTSDQLQSQLSTALDASEKLTKDLDQAKSEHARAAEQHTAEQQQQRQSHEIEQQKVETRLASQAASLDKFKTTIEDLRASQEAAAKFAEDRHSKLQATLEHTRRELNDSRSQLQASEVKRQQQSQALEEDLARATKRVKTLEEAGTRLQGELAKSSESLAATSKDLAALRKSSEDQISTLRAQHQASQDLLAKEREARDVLISEHKADIEEFAQRLKEAHEAVQAAQADLKKEVNSRETADAKLREAEALVSSTKESLQTSETQLKDERQRSQELSGALEEKKSQLNKTYAAQKEAEQLAQQRQDSIVDKSSQIDRLQREATKLGEQISSTQDALRRKEDENSAQRDELGVQRHEVRVQTEAKEGLEKDVASWKDQHGKVESALADAKTAQEQTMSDLNSTQDQLDSATSNLSNAREIIGQRNETIRNERASSRDKMQKLGQQFKKAAELMTSKSNSQQEAIDRLMLTSSKNRQLHQKEVADLREDLAAIIVRADDLERNGSELQEQKEQVSRARDACLHTIHSLLKSLRDQSARAATTMLKAQEDRRQSEARTRAVFKGLKDSVKVQLNQMADLVHQSQGSCERKQAALLKVSDALGEAEAQLGRSRARETETMNMLDQERRKRKEATTVVTMLSEKFSDLNKSATGVLRREARASAHHGEVISSLQQKHSDLVAKLHHEHAHVSSSLQQDHERAVDLLKQKSAEAAASLEQDHSQAIALLKQEQSQALVQVKQQHRGVFTSAQEEHARAMSLLKEEQSRAVTQLRNGFGLHLKDMMQCSRNQSLSTSQAFEAFRMQILSLQRQSSGWRRQTDELNRRLLLKEHGMLKKDRWLSVYQTAVGTYEKRLSGQTTALSRILTESRSLSQQLQFAKQDSIACRQKLADHQRLFGHLVARLTAFARRIETAARVQEELASRLRASQRQGTVLEKKLQAQSRAVFLRSSQWQAQLSQALQFLSRLSLLLHSSQRANKQQADRRQRMETTTMTDRLALANLHQALASARKDCLRRPSLNVGVQTDAINPEPSLLQAQVAQKELIQKTATASMSDYLALENLRHALRSSRDSYQKLLTIDTGVQANVATTALAQAPPSDTEELRVALGEARAETSRFEMFWRISLVDLAHAVDVCKALQAQIDDSHRAEERPGLPTRSPTRITVATQTRLLGQTKAIQTEPVLPHDVEETAVIALSRCCIQLQSDKDNLQHQLAQAKLDHQHAGETLSHASRDLQSCQEQLVLTELDLKCLKVQRKQTEADGLATLNSTATKILRDCRVISGNSPSETTVEVGSDLEQLHHSMDQIRKFVDYLCIEATRPKGRGRRSPAGLKDSYSESGSDELKELA